MSAPRRSSTGCWIAIVALAVILGTSAAFVQVSLRRLERRGAPSKCQNNAKQLALAAIQYSDDRRWFPHVRGAKELDGDATTSDGPRCFRALIALGYLDQPDLFVCPTSADRVAVLPPSGPGPVVFGWGGRLPETAASPIAAPASCDRPLTELTDLSFAYTRAPLTSNASSRTPLLSDRRRGNHPEGQLAVAFVDAHVELTKDADKLAALDEEGGKLGLLPPDRWTEFETPGAERGPLLSFVVAAGMTLALGGLALLLFRKARDGGGREAGQTLA